MEQDFSDKQQYHISHRNVTGDEEHMAVRDAAPQRTKVINSRKPQLTYGFIGTSWMQIV